MAQTATAISDASHPIRLVACVADETTREAVARAVAQLGWPEATIRAGGVAAALDLVESGRVPDVLLVDLADADAPVAAIADVIAVCGGDTRVIALGAVNDVGLFRDLVALGVSDYLVKPFSGDLLADASARAARGVANADAARKDARLLAFLGSRGGVGTTTLAIATAWLLAHEFKLRPALLDLDLYFGNLALSLDLEPGRGLREALEKPERTDNLLVAAAMVRNESKLPILAAEEPLEQMPAISPDAAGTLLAALSHDHDCIVADVPRTLDPLGRAVLAAADQVVVVTDLSLAALRDTLRIADLTRSLGCRATPIVVANQVGAAHRGEIGRAEFERGLSAKLAVAVPFDAKAAMAAARTGKPLAAAATSSKATVELRRLATKLSGRPAKARGGFLRLFG